MHRIDASAIFFNTAIVQPPNMHTLDIMLIIGNDLNGNWTTRGEVFNEKEEKEREKEKKHWMPALVESTCNKIQDIIRLDLD